MKSGISYGINTQNRSMYPCTKEVSQTVAVCHQVATIVYGFKYLAGAKSQKPWSKDISQAIGSGRNDASVMMLQSSVRRQGKCQ